MHPNKEPIKRIIGIANIPKSFRLFAFNESKLKVTAPIATTPSIDKSMPPRIIINVTPIDNTKGIPAELAIRPAFVIVKKFELKKLKIIQRNINTINGAK